MAQSAADLHRAVSRLRTVTLAEAYERILAGDPLKLVERVERALDRAAHWVSVDAAVLRAARGLAAALRDAPERRDALATWVETRVEEAVAELLAGAPPAEEREREARARHDAHVSATLGVDDRRGADAQMLFEQLSADERRLLLRGLRALRDGRTRELDAASWGRFTVTWRALLQRVLSPQAP